MPFYQMAGRWVWVRVPVLQWLALGRGQGDGSGHSFGSEATLQQWEPYSERTHMNRPISLLPSLLYKNKLNPACPSPAPLPCPAVSLWRRLWELAPRACGTCLRAPASTPPASSLWTKSTPWASSAQRWVGGQFKVVGVLSGWQGERAGGWVRDAPCIIWMPWARRAFSHQQKTPMSRAHSRLHPALTPC